MPCNGIGPAGMPVYWDLPSAQPGGSMGQDFVRSASIPDMTTIDRSHRLSPLDYPRPAPSAKGRAADDSAGAVPGTRSTEPALTADQKHLVEELKRRDAEVRQHEQAHKAAGGPYAGAPSYQYTTGPDGRRYVTGGEVKVDVAPVRGNPEATIRKMEIVKNAALAPTEPSPQDRAVAARADAVKMQAQAELQARVGSDAPSDGVNEPGAGPSARSPAAYRQAIAAYGTAGRSRPAPILDISG